MTTMEYLSDEDLEQLIQRIETESEVEAPGYLFERIMEQIEADESAGHSMEESLPTTQAEVQMLRPPRRRNHSRSLKREFHIYCAKVLVTAAAAIVLVFAAPAMNGRAESLKIDSSETIMQERDQTNLLKQMGDSYTISDLLTGNHLIENLSTLNLLNTTWNQKCD